MKKIILLAVALLCLSALFTACDTEVVTPDETTAEVVVEETTSAPEEKYTVIAENGEIAYNVIYPKNGTAYEQSNAELLKDQLADIAKIEPKYRADVGVYDENAFEIYVGNTAYKESAEALSKIGYGEYIVVKIGNKIVVNAYESEAMRNGVNAFISLVKSTSIDGQTRLPETFELHKDISPVLSAIPKIEGATPLGYCVRADQSYTMAVQKSNKAMFENYLKTLEASGYSKYAENTIGTKDENLFATYHNDKNIINIGYFDKARSMNVSIEAKTFSDLVPAKDNYTGEHKTKMFLLGVTGGNFENGMSFVIQLSDGRFIVYDGGGADGAKDSKLLYETLKAKAGSDKITIAAWVITHCHGDHATCFDTFMKSEYITKKLVTVENIIFSPTTYNYGTAGSEGATLEANVVVNGLIKVPNANLIIAHPGQEFVFADLRMEVLFTLDAMMPYDFNAEKADIYNAASIVTKLYFKDSTGKEKTVLMTGDTYKDCVSFMCTNYGSYLKSDYLQVPHHGASNGGSVEFYDLIKPDILIWPAGEKLFTQVTSGKSFNSVAANNHLLELVGAKKDGNKYDPKDLGGVAFVATVGSVKEIPID